MGKISWEREYPMIKEVVPKKLEREKCTSLLLSRNRLRVKESSTNVDKYDLDSIILDFTL